MLKVTDNQIYLTRGDTADIEVDITNEDGIAYDSSHDNIFFRLKSQAASTYILLEKQLSITEGKVVLQLSEEDTCNLPIIKARYEIEVVTSNNAHYTVIENELFEIGPELENHNG
jgi:hypothetical protein